MEINGSNWCQNAQVVQVKKAFEKWRALYNVEACHCQVPLITRHISRLFLCM